MNFNLKIICLFIIIAISLGACSNDAEPGTSNDVSNPEFNRELLSVTSLQFQSAKMEIGELKEHEFYQSVKANGVFDVPPENKASISAYFSGYVKEMNLLTGQKVVKGQVLFVLENPEYIEIQQDFLETKGRLIYLESDYIRQKHLAKDKISSQKKYLKAEADYTVSRVRYESLKKKLYLMNINPNELTEENIQTTISVLSPLKGYITNVYVTKGVFLNPDDIAITITNTDHLHLKLNIFEKDLSSVAIGQPIKFRIQDNFNKEYNGIVQLVNQSIDAKKRTVILIGHLSDSLNPGIFVPGMYIEAEIITSKEFKTALPMEAVVEVENENYVLILKESANDNRIFEKKTVITGQSADGFIEIKNYSEFPDDARFLVKGAFNLITE